MIALNHNVWISFAAVFYLEERNELALRKNGAL